MISYDMFFSLRVFSGARDRPSSCLLKISSLMRGIKGLSIDHDGR